MRDSDISRVAARAARTPYPSEPSKFSLPDPEDERLLSARIAIIKSQQAAIRSNLRAEAFLLRLLHNLVAHMAAADLAANPAATGVSVIKGLTLKRTLAALESIESLTSKIGGNGFALGSWEGLSRAARLNMQQLALESHDWRTFTLHLTDEIEGCSRDCGRTPTDYLRHRLAQRIKRDFGESASFWFKIERFSKPRGGIRSDHVAPHLHGSIRVPSGAHDSDLEVALRLAGGFPRASPPGRPPAELKTPKRANAGLGWVIYALGTAYLDDVPAGQAIPEYLRSFRSRGWSTLDDSVAVTRDLQRAGKLLYNRLRSHVRVYRSLH